MAQVEEVLAQSQTEAVHMQDFRVRLAQMEQALARMSRERHSRRACKDVQKCVPDKFAGDKDAWDDWSFKFRSYMAPQLNGTVGESLAYVDRHRAISCSVASVGEVARAPSAVIYSALILTCTSKALVTVKEAGGGEGLEA